MPESSSYEMSVRRGSLRAQGSDLLCQQGPGAAPWTLASQPPRTSAQRRRLHTGATTVAGAVESGTDRGDVGPIERAEDQSPDDLLLHPTGLALRWCALVGMTQALQAKEAPLRVGTSRPPAGQPMIEARPEGVEDRQKWVTTRAIPCRAQVGRKPAW